MRTEPELRHQQTNVDEILDLLDGYVAASVLSAALEFGLFWQLELGPATAEEIAKRYALPMERCSYWLQYLCKLGLLKRNPDGYAVTGKARNGILDAYSQASWRLLAREAREGYAPFQYYTSNLGTPGSLWQLAGLEPPNYLAQMDEDLERARRFTRMLFELHQDLAGEIAKRLDLNQVYRLMDLGGGSGVISLALLAAHPQLTAVVVDIPNVCQAGGEIAEEVGLAERLAFHPADFMKDELPAGFDMVLECDVGMYSEILFNKVRGLLRSEGRYVILDQFAPAPGIAPASRLTWAVQGSLSDPAFRFRQVDETVRLLEACGFQDVVVEAFPISHATATRFTDDFFKIDARVG